MRRNVRKPGPKNVVQKMMALSLAASMMISSSGFQVLAQETENQISVQEQSTEDAKTMAAKESEEQSEQAGQESESAAQSEQERQESESAAQSEQERQQRESAAQSEQERQQRESAAQSEQERQQRESAAQSEQERQQRESAVQSEQDAQQGAGEESESAAQSGENVLQGEAGNTSDSSEQQGEDARQSEMDKEKEDLPEETAAAELNTTVTQEFFVGTDGTLSVKYTVSVENKTEKNDAEGVAVKAVLGEKTSWYKKEDQTKDILFIEKLSQIPAGCELDELQSYSAEELEKYESAVIWKDQKIEGGKKKEYVFFAHVGEDTGSRDELLALFFVDGEKIEKNKIQWKNESLIETWKAELESETDISVDEISEGEQAAELLAGNSTSITNVTGSIVSDGTAPFDKEQGPGCDTGAKNRTVRPYDTITYETTIAVNASAQDQDTVGKIRFEITLPLTQGEAEIKLTNENGFSEVIADTDAEGSQKVTGLYTFGNKGEAMTVILPFVIQAKAMNSGDTVTPKAEFWLDGNTDQADKYTVTYDTVTVSNHDTHITEANTAIVSSGTSGSAGTAGVFDAAGKDSFGYDSSAENSVVRAGDTLTYKAVLEMGSYTETAYEADTVEFSAVLPAAEAQAVFKTDAMAEGCSNLSVTVSADGQTQTLTGTYALNQTAAASHTVEIPLVIEVKSMNQGENIAPSGTFRLAGSCIRNSSAGTPDTTKPDEVEMYAKNCAAHNWTKEVYDVTYPTVTVSNHDIYIKQITAEIGASGTAPFDSDNTAGNDMDEKNDIIRSFDTMYYNLEVAMDSFSAAHYEEGVIWLEATLPVTAQKAVFDEDAMKFLDTCKVTTNADGTQTLLGSYKVTKSQGASEAIPGTQTLQIAVKVRGMENGSKLKPVGKIWMQDNYTQSAENGDGTAVTACPTHKVNEVKAIEFPEVTVSAKLQLNIELKNAGIGDHSIEGTFNFNEGRQINSEYGEVKGRLFAYGITIQMRQTVTGKGMKGQELPSGPIELTFDIASSYHADDKTTYRADSDEMANYQPLVYSMEGCAETFSNIIQSDGRYLKSKEGYSPNNTSVAWKVPKNKLTSDAQAYYSCEDGGKWTIDQDYNASQDRTVKITVDGYKITQYLFPTTHYRSGNNLSTYYTPGIAMEAVEKACFSAGEIWVVQPYEYQDKDQNTHNIVDEYGSGTFTITAEESLVSASSASGANCTGQVVTTDDKCSFTQYISPLGVYENLIWYTRHAGTGSAYVGGWYNTLGEMVYDTGDDYCMLGSNELGVFFSYVYYPQGIMKNRQAASNVMLKFDGSVMEPRYQDTGNTITLNFRIINNGADEFSYFYGYLPDGGNWSSEAAMIAADENSVIWESTYDGSKTCVAVLIERRGIVESLGRIEPDYIFKVKVKEDPSLIKEDVNDNVHIICERTKLWTVRDLGIPEDTEAGEEITARIKELVPSVAGRTPGTMEYYKESFQKAYDGTYPEGKTYQKETYNENGVVGTHSNGDHGGDSLLLLSYKTSIEKYVAQTVTNNSGATVPKENFNLDRDERTADFVLIPKMKMNCDPSDEETSVYTTLTVTDTLPAGISYVQGSARWNAVYDQTEGTETGAGTIVGGTVMKELTATETLPAELGSTYAWSAQEEDDTVVKVEKLSDGSTLLTFQIRGVKIAAANEIGRIYYRTFLGDPANNENDLQNNAQLSGEATVQTTEDSNRKLTLLNGNRTSEGISITKLGATAFGKTVLKQMNEVNEDMTWTVSSNNNGSSTSVMDVMLLDSMPADQDEAGSSFSGSYKITDWEIISDVDAADFRLYYTTKEKYQDYVLSTEDNEAEKKITWAAIMTSEDWNYLEIGGEKKASFEKVSEFVTAWAVEGSLSGGESLQIRITVHQDTPNGGDKLINTASTELFVRKAPAYRVARGVSGYVWYDEDLDGRKEENEKPVSNVTVMLQVPSEKEARAWVTAKDLNGEDIPSAKTNQNGYYQFAELPSGSYRIVFKSDDLDSYSITTANAAGVPGSVNSKAIASEAGNAEISGISLTPAEQMLSPTQNVLYQNAGFGKTVSFQVTKEWEDDESIKASTRPESITADLYKHTTDGKNSTKELVRRLVLNEENNWKGTFENLPYLEDGEEIDYTLSDGSVYYTLEEKAVEGYTPSIGKITGDGQNGFKAVIKNSTKVKEVHNPVSLDIQKYRADTEAIVKGAVFKLTDAEDSGKSVTAATDENGKAVFTFAVLADGDTSILNLGKWGTDETSKTYRLTEESAPAGYTKEETEWTVTVTREENPTVTMKADKSGFVKEWDYTISVTPDENFTAASEDANAELTVYNTYLAEGAADLTGTKTVVNGPMRDDFTFTIYEDADKDELLEENEKVSDGWTEGTAAVGDEPEVPANKEPDVEQNTVSAEAEDTGAENGVSDTGTITFRLHYNQEDLLRRVDSISGTKYYYKSLTKTYYVVENDLSDEAEAEGYTKDDSRYTVNVVITDNGDGTLTVTPTVEDNEEKLLFTNHLEAVGNAEFTAKKTVTGGVMKAFDFCLYSDEACTQKVTETAFQNNTEDGTITFVIPKKDGKDYAFDMTDMKITAGEKSYYTVETAEGSAAVTKDFVYYIKENQTETADGYGYKSDGAVYKVTVTMQLQDGALKQTETKFEKQTKKENGYSYTEADQAEFVNTYTAAGSVVLEGTKKLNGKRITPMTDGEFTFSVKENDREVAAGTSKADGSIAFTKIRYTEKEVGTHTYVISENKGTDQNITYTDRTVTVTVEVTDNGDGTLKAEAVYPQDGAVFENTYTQNKKASVEVTKKLIYNGSEVDAVDQTFYVGLFMDEACTQPAGEVKALVFKNGSSATVKFTDLEPDRTYYVGETDDMGNVIVSGKTATGAVFAANFAEGNKAVTKLEGGITRVTFENIFYDIPEGFYREGELTITKKLLDAEGKEFNSNEIFYAGIFADAAYTTLSDQVSQNIVALNLNGASSASQTIKAALDKDGRQTLYVTEVDAKGNPVAGQAGFAYQVSIDKTAVVWDGTSPGAAVTITNQMPEEETEIETEEETEVEMETETETETEKAKETEAAKTVKTGDETPITMYVILLAAAAAVIVALAIWMRKRRAGKKQ